MTNIVFARKPGIRAGLAGLAFFLSAVSGSAIAQNATDGAPAQDNRPSLELVGVIMKLPDGMRWLSLGTGTLCLSSGNQSSYGPGGLAADLAGYTRFFKPQMEGAGYKVIAPDETNVFVQEAASADYEVAAVITALRINACAGGLLLGNSPDDVRGDATMSVDWQVFSPIKKTVVARLTTTASTKLDKAMVGGIGQLLAGAFAANAHQLAGATDFRSAMNAPKALVNGFVLAGRQNKIGLAGSLKATKRPIADAVGSVVTLITADGSGSGVLVSDDGYFLTDAHVVEDAKEIRVRWSDGIETLGQVVRVSKDRDVALVKSGARGRLPLAINLGPLNAGQKVYAIGSPSGEKFQGTVTSGVVSTAERIRNGLRYIQSDTMVSHGSSGGALLDETGALIGLTDLGIPDREGQNVGLNLFTPIGDAIDFLSLEQK